VTTGQEDLLAVWNACGFYRLVGMRVVRADGAGSRLEVEVGVEHLQAYGTAHGGVTAGLLDAAMGLAALAAVPPEEGCATVTMTVGFTAGARPGPLAAEGRVLHLGRRLVTAAAEARDGESALVAVAQGTFSRFPLAAS
jgi:1,4-dihydroxy-2-naphthoyl-CoA hydrolase